MTSIGRLSRSTRRIVRAAAIALTLAAAGCAGKRATTQIAAGVRDGTPSVEGVDLAWFGVRDPGSETMARVLGAGREPAFFDAACGEAWKRNGLRAVVLSESQARDLPERFDRVGAVQRVELVETPSWGSFLSGPEWAGSVALAMPDGALRLSPGSLRLLGRAWWEPVLRTDGLESRVRLELVPQYQSRERGAAWLTGAEDRSMLERGLVIWRLGAAVSLENGEALVIVPEEPSVDWEAIVARESAPRPEAPPPASAGPQAPGPVTVGQALLSEALMDYRSPRRVVVVITPRPRKDGAVPAKERH